MFRRRAFNGKTRTDLVYTLLLTCQRNISPYCIYIEQNIGVIFGMYTSVRINIRKQSR